MQHPWNEVICDMQRLHWPWYLIQALALSSKQLVNIMTVQQENIQHWLTMIYLICLRIFSDNHDGRAASASSWCHLTTTGAAICTPWAWVYPYPNPEDTMTSFFHGIWLVAFEVVWMYLACRLLYCTYVKTATARDLACGLLHCELWIEP